MKKVLAIILALVLIFAFAACGEDTAPASAGSSGGSSSSAPAGGSSASGTPSSVKVAVISPMTGALAEQGESADWMVKHFTQYINEEMGGIEFADYGTKLPVEFVLYDNESSSTKASEVTMKAITDDGVDVVLACHVPDMVIPVSQVCSSQGVPSIHFDCPLGPWLANGPFDWSFLAHTGAETYVDAYESIWKAAGYKPGDTEIGLIFANDTDGTALHPAYQSGLEARGWTCFFPGLYTAGTTDYSDIIKQYKDRNIEVIFGTMVNPEFAAFWEQCQQLGYAPKVIVIGKAYMLESQVRVVGEELADGLVLEGWWHRTFPYSSQLTGLSNEEFCQLYEAESGHGVAAPVAAEYAAMEVLIDALTRAANLDKETIRTAIEETELDTVMGHIKYDPETHGEDLPCVGCQWVLQDDGKTLKQEIVGNGNPSNGIAVTADIKTSGAVWMK